MLPPSLALTNRNWCYYEITIFYIIITVRKIVPYLSKMLKIGREKNERRIVVGRRLFFKMEEIQYNIEMVFEGGRWVNIHDHVCGQG